MVGLIVNAYYVLVLGLVCVRVLIGVLVHIGLGSLGRLVPACIYTGGGLQFCIVERKQKINKKRKIRGTRRTLGYQF